MRTFSLKHHDHSPLPHVASRQWFSPGLIVPRSDSSGSQHQVEWEVEFAMANEPVTADAYLAPVPPYVVRMPSDVGDSYCSHETAMITFFAP
jgi:hypothetical protein